MSDSFKDDSASKGPFVGTDFQDEDFREVVSILRERSGFDLDSYKDRCIKRRIASRVRASGLNDSGRYVDLLRSDNSELEALLAVLTIHVSQFFRNPSTYRVLEEKVLAELVAAARGLGERRLRLWSVGCAGGEETYSLALLLHDMKLDDFEISIIGSDVSEPILEKAQQAEYKAAHLFEVPAPVRQRYFEQIGEDRYRLDPEVRGMVRFQRHNVLADADYPEADLILCRNVMIYFSREEQNKILSRFASTLGRDRFLVLGRAETLMGTAREYFRSEYPVERIYRCQKRPAETAAAECR